MKNLSKIRGIVSSLLIIVFLLVAFTGIGLYLSPSGRIARESSWSFMGLSKWQLENMHTVSGFFMMLIVALHLLLNYKMLLAEIKLLFKK